MAAAVDVPGSVGAGPVGIALAIELGMRSPSEHPPSADALIGAARARELPRTGARRKEAEIAALYERPLVLVWPDGHVSWRGDETPQDPGYLIDLVRGAASKDVKAESADV